MDADALGQRFVGWQCPAPGAAPLTRDAQFEAVFAFYEEDRADGCDPAAGRDRLVFRWGSWGPGGAVFGVELAREVFAIRDPGEWWRSVRRWQRRGAKLPRQRILTLPSGGESASRHGDCQPQGSRGPGGGAGDSTSLPDRLCERGFAQ
jgi:hypothetical protein